MTLGPPRDCILCGIGGDERRPWALKYRAIYTVLSNWDAARLSPVVERQGDQNHDVVPLDQDFGVDVSVHKVGEDWVRISFNGFCQVPRSSATPLWGYAIHDICWNILCSINSSVNTSSKIQAIFELCRSQPADDYTLYWDHTYDGLLHDWNLYPGDSHYTPEKTHSIIPWIDPENVDFEFLEAHDPEPSDEQIFVERALQSRASNVTVGPRQASEKAIEIASTTTCQIDELHSTSNILETLPFEIICEILNFIPDSSDVASFLQTSIGLDQLELPPEFWKSRFLYDNELAHLRLLLPVGIGANDFKTCYLNAMANQESLGFVNRKRIWKLAINFSKAIELRSEFKLRSPRLQTSDDGLVSERTDNRWLTAHADVFPFKEDVHLGARLLYSDNLSIQEADINQIWVSQVTLYDGKYISGLQIENTSVGYHNPNEMTRVTWKGSSRAPGIIKGFYVAMSQYALRGVRVYCVPGGLSDWVGDHQDLTQQVIAFGTGRVRRLRFGLDALKGVSLSISQHADDEVGAQEEDDHGPWAPGLWFPEVPDPTLRAIGLDHPKMNHVGVKLTEKREWNEWTPFYSCIFGGVDGSWLPQLQHIDFELTKKYKDSWGSISGYEAINRIIFSYRMHKDGKESEIFGFKPWKGQGAEDEQKIRMTLDCLNGERITGIDGYYHPECTMFLAGLSIHTNKGRRFQMPEDIESRASEYVVQCQHAGERTVVGFYGQCKSRTCWGYLGLLLADLSAEKHGRLLASGLEKVGSFQ